MFERLITDALTEDLDTYGDLTTDCIVSEQNSNFLVNAREDLIFAGAVIVENFSKVFCGSIYFSFISRDGSSVKSGQCAVSGHGSTSTILSTERVLLNLLQRASSIASITRQFVDSVKNTNAVIRSTRKTAPCLRKLDLYAVSVGGGESYRTGLFDGVLIKDNHIASCSGITECVRRVREKLGDVVITVECDTMEQVEEALNNSVHTVMFDNMKLEDIKTAVGIVNKRSKTEASGGITLENALSIAECGVDYISVGSITNSVRCKDMGLDFN